MDDPPRHPATGEDTDVRPERESTTGTPRWVKVFGIIALVVVLLFVILLFTRGPGSHGPGLHTSSGDTPPTIVTESGGIGGHAQPPGGSSPW